MRILLSLFLMFAALTGSERIAFASEGHDWLVKKVTGQAWIAAKDIRPLRVKRGMILKPGQTLSTRARTRVLLSRGKERIQIGPEAIMALPPMKYQKVGKTMILHQSGRLDLAVNKKSRPHFSVKTPYLAAVVKGTTFSIEVRHGKALVSVDSGKVGVSSHLSGETVDIVRGQSAGIDMSMSDKPKFSVTAKPGAAKPAKVRKSRKIKKATPDFRALVKVKGKQRQLETGDPTKIISEAEQTARETRGNGHGQSSRNQHGRTKGDRGDAPGNSGNAPGHNGGSPGNGGNAPGHSGASPGNSGNAPGHSGGSPGNSGNTPGHSGDSPGNSGNAPGHSGGSPGNSGNAPGRNK